MCTVFGVTLVHSCDELFRRLLFIALFVVSLCCAYLMRKQGQVPFQKRTLILITIMWALPLSDVDNLDEIKTKY